jgi:hypothetical protein
MYRKSSVALVRFAPYCMALQIRFRWHHRQMFDKMRRLMDATCFVVDWQGPPRDDTLSSWGGSWTHIVTCSHVLTPWNHPNFYPPTGLTGFVHKLTVSDCFPQARLATMEGLIMYRHFLNRQYQFIHNNPRLDVACGHPEQNFKRNGETKMMWFTNEGYLVRPRFELLEDLAVGDDVWIYGMTAKTDVVDEDSPKEPLMIPTGVKCRVKHLEEEHFFCEITDEMTQINMGMCGGPVIRNGKLVGMLTATVHEDSENKLLAGTAMCTYGRDIRKFLLEVEKQMENPVETGGDDTVFDNKRHSEGYRRKKPVDWDKIDTRLARMCPVPLTNWKFEAEIAEEEERINHNVYGRSGPFSQETQENMLGMDMGQSTNDSSAPDGAANVRQPGVGERGDHSPRYYYGQKDKFKTSNGNGWDSPIMDDAKDFIHGGMSGMNPSDLDQMTRTVEQQSYARQQMAYAQAATGAVPERPADTPNPFKGGFRGTGGDSDLLDGLWEQH